MTALEYINLIDYDAWVDHSNPRAHKSKKCFTCFIGNATFIPGRIKSPLTWIGGKSKQWSKIKNFIDKAGNFDTFIDLFGGGGLVSINALQDYYDGIRKFIYNDIDFEIYNFWNFMKNCNCKSEINFDKLKNYAYPNFKNVNDIENIVKNNHIKTVFSFTELFFINNCLKFNGLRWGTYSQKRYEQNFNQAKINRLEQANILLKNKELFNVSNKDYKEILSCSEGTKNKAFIYADPPYTIAKDKHYRFHNVNLFELKDHLEKSNANVLISLDDTKEVREIFENWNIYEDSWAYTASNAKKHKTKFGKELWITNF